MTLPPMAEIDFWRDRSSKVSTVYEQLQLPGVKKVGAKRLSEAAQRQVLEVLEASEPPVLQQFQAREPRSSCRHGRTSLEPCRACTWWRRTSLGMSWHALDVLRGQCEVPDDLRVSC